MSNRYPVPFNVKLAGQVAQTGRTINLTRTDDSENSFMCMAIREPDGKILGVISLIDKEGAGANSTGFSANDERQVNITTTFSNL